MTKEENRKQRRIPLNIRAKMHKIASKEIIEAELVDISNHGASFKVTVPLNANDRIMISIVIDKNGKLVESEEVPASVRWVEGSAKEFLAGAKFDIMVCDKSLPIFNQCLEFLETCE